MGTYSNTSGAWNKDDCTPCDIGYYCNAIAGGAPTGPCWGGYFCNETGSETPRKYAADPGNVPILHGSPHRIIKSYEVLLSFWSFYGPLKGL